jgi:site-specific recombinase XerD
MRDMLKLEQLLVHNGLAPSTRKQYLTVAKRMGPDPVVWFRDEVGKNRPRNTLLPLRATAVYVLMSERALSKAEASMLLPEAKGTQGLRVEGLTETELPLYNTAVAGLGEPVRTLLLLLPWSGLRITEAVTLRWEDVTPREQTGKVTVAVRQGKGRKDRLVPLGVTGTRLLLTLRGRVRGTPLDTPWVFATRGGHLTAGVARKRLNAVLGAAAGLNNVTPHRLRHTYATRLIERGASVKDVQVLLGHTSIASTERYLHPSTAHLGGVVDRLE